MMSTKSFGDEGEERAVLALEKLGYEIQDRNWRSRFGEIDIIATKDEFLVFVEVKRKSSDRYGGPGDMITATKLRRIEKTALAYINKSGFQGPFRIDAALVIDDRVELLENISL